MVKYSNGYNLATAEQICMKFWHNVLDMMENKSYLCAGPAWARGHGPAGPNTGIFKWLKLGDVWMNIPEILTQHTWDDGEHNLPMRGARSGPRAWTRWPKHWIFKWLKLGDVWMNIPEILTQHTWDDGEHNLPMRGPVWAHGHTYLFCTYLLFKTRSLVESSKSVGMVVGLGVLSTHAKY